MSLMASTSESNVSGRGHWLRRAVGRGPHPAATSESYRSGVSMPSPGAPGADGCRSGYALRPSLRRAAWSPASSVLPSLLVGVVVGLGPRRRDLREHGRARRCPGVCVAGSQARPATTKSAIVSAMSTVEQRTARLVPVVDPVHHPEDLDRGELRVDVGADRRLPGLDDQRAQMRSYRSRAATIDLAPLGARASGSRGRRRPS